MGQAKQRKDEIIMLKAQGPKPRPNQSYVEVKQAWTENGKTTVHRQNLICHKLLSNTPDGFKAEYEDALGRYTAEFKVEGDKVLYTLTNQSEEAVNKVRSLGLRFFDEVDNDTREMNLEFAVYEYEYLLGAAATAHKLQCRSLVNKLAEMYPKYSVQ